MARDGDFSRGAALPPGPRASAIQRAIDCAEEKLADDGFVELYAEQANVFSAVVGIFGTKALDSVSNYEKGRHAGTARAGFPDLSRRGAKRPLRPDDSLECKAGPRTCAIQSRCDHAGRHAARRHPVDPAETIEKGRPLIMWRGGAAFLQKGDWKYEKSGAGSSGGGRTHTFGIKQPAKALRGTAACGRSGITVRGGRPIPSNGRPGQSRSPGPGAGPRARRPRAPKRPR